MLVTAVSADHDCSSKAHLQNKPVVIFWLRINLNFLKDSNGTRRSSHGELLDEELQVTDCTPPTSLQGTTTTALYCVENYSHHVQHEIRSQFPFLLTDFFIKTAWDCWVRCKQIHQLFRCILDKEAARGMFAVVSAKQKELKSSGLQLKPLTQPRSLSNLNCTVDAMHRYYGKQEFKNIGIGHKKKTLNVSPGFSSTVRYWRSCLSSDPSLPSPL